MFEEYLQDVGIVGLPPLLGHHPPGLDAGLAPGGGAGGLLANGRVEQRDEDVDGCSDVGEGGGEEATVLGGVRDAVARVGGPVPAAVVVLPGMQGWSSLWAMAPPPPEGPHGALVVVLPARTVRGVDLRGEEVWGVCDAPHVPVQGALKCTLANGPHMLGLWAWSQSATSSQLRPTPKPPAESPLSTKWVASNRLKWILRWFMVFLEARIKSGP